MTFKHIIGNYVLTSWEILLSLVDYSFKNNKDMRTQLLPNNKIFSITNKNSNGGILGLNQKLTKK